MPRVAVRAVIIQNQHILLAKHHDARGNWYITPGGGVEHGETLEEAFHRELAEEIDARADFGKVLFMREVIAQRHPSPYLPAGLHQIEFFIEAYMHGKPGLQASSPDPDQIGFAWLPLKDLDKHLFFPNSLIKNFQEQSWPDFYYGEVP